MPLLEVPGMIPGETAVGRRVEANRRRAVALLLLAGLTCGAVIGLVGLLVLAPLAAVILGLVVAAAVMAAAWWGSEALARHLVHAQPADPLAHARLINLVEGLCVTAGLPQPRLYVVDDAGLNALTMGRNARHASLVVTSGLLSGLNRIELEAVLAHELSHVKSDDILTSTLAVALFGILAGAARATDSDGPTRLVAWLTVPATAPAGLGLQLAVGDDREALADMSGVSLTRYPPALVNAFEKLQDSGTVVRSGSPATAHLWLAPPSPPPASGHQSWVSRLFETHPPLEARIEALREL